ncbi:MAG: chemotaxis protein CheA [Pseudomonadota bacterium]
MDELLADFVAETREMLEASEGEIVAWEADPADRSRLDSIFRFVHTVKGNCGFFDFPRLADLSHAAEDALADVRAGRREADSALVSAVLAIIDRIAEMVDAIEAGQDFPAGGDDVLIAALEASPPSEPVDASPEAVSDDGCAEQPSAAKKPDTAIAAQRTIRLPVDLLDRVMSGVSDMVLARNDLAHRLRQAGTQPTIDGPFERLTTILSDVRDAITRMRMQRIETLFGSIPRLVRDLSADLGKQVTIDLEGGDVELDREMIEMIRDPLTHIIRNAIDHGIESPEDRVAADKSETGVVSIAARQSGNKISIVITDDGRGLDEARIVQKAIAKSIVSQEQGEAMSRDEKLQLVFEPGLSTAEQVSSVSGRGVGLDVVRDNLEKVGGSIKVTSTPGRGSLFYLQIPLTLAIISGLTVEVGDQRFAIPQSYVEEVFNLGTGAIEYTKVGETALVTFRDRRTPCLSLAHVLGIEPLKPDEDATLVLLRLANGDLFALAVDRIHNISDLVVKPLPRSIMKTELYGGSTLLDDGQPILVLDMPLIALNAGLVSDTRAAVKKRGEDSMDKNSAAIARAMLFTDYSGRRSAVRLELVQRIETISADVIEETAGAARAVIDGVILPLVGLPEGVLPAGRIRLLRLTDGASELLHAVREVDDAVELTNSLKQVHDDPMVEALTLVHGQTVTLIDGHELFTRHGEVPEIIEKPICHLPDSEWAHTILGPLVRAAGYETITGEAASAGDIAILFEDETENQPAVSDETQVIRLRSQPDAADGDSSIYRYDRESLIAALHQARAAGAR